MRGHVEKRGKKYYTIVLEHGFVTDPTTGKKKRKREYIPTDITDRRLAERKMQEIIAEKMAGTYVPPSKLTFGEYLHQWLNTHKANLAPSTFRSYKMFIDKHITPALGHILLTELTPLHLQQYYSDKLTRGRVDGKGGLKGRTVLHHHRMIHEALTQAMRWNLVPRNVADAVIPPREEKPEIHPPSLDEAVRVAEACDEPFRTVLLVAIWTGARLGEVLALRWEDVSKDSICITRTLDKQPGQDYTFREPKRHSRRVVPIPPMLSEILEAQRKETGLVFRSPKDPSKPLHPSSVWHHFKRIAKRLGIAVDSRVHDLRHAYASTLLAEGIDPKTVQELTGHKEIRTLFDYYAHVMAKQRQQVIEKLQELEWRRNGDDFKKVGHLGDEPNPQNSGSEQGK